MEDSAGIDQLELDGFILAYDREQAYSDAFCALLQRLGVDWRRDSEVHYIGKEAGGLELYGGCFHFIGRIRQTSDRAVLLGRNLTVDFRTSLNDVPPEFAGKPVVQLNFEVAVPRPVTA